MVEKPAQPPVPAEKQKAEKQQLVEQAFKSGVLTRAEALAHLKEG